MIAWMDESFWPEASVLSLCAVPREKQPEEEEEEGRVYFLTVIMSLDKLLENLENSSQLFIAQSQSC
ncbi:hypothetical protein T01_395 [Trichinella spiralis]|uniref:Uncharacterized protein n=1 Tax=Trichinella spiralis TaxID=6334 RepID=A0A0V1B4W6_TRISP|nr:hypothetical protein T01_395 [Trichinella spiralis]